MTVTGTPELVNTPLLVENVLSMCLKEAVNNVVKHSSASTCSISIKQSAKETLLKVYDNGKGLGEKINWSKGHGLRGIKERLEFVNGTLDIHSTKWNNIEYTCTQCNPTTQTGGIDMIRIVIAEDQRMVLRCSRFTTRFGRRYGSCR